MKFWIRTQFQWIRIRNIDWNINDKDNKVCGFDVCINSNVNYYLVRRQISEFQFPWAGKIWWNLPPTRVADPQHFNADLDTEISFHFNADPDPTFHFNVDPGPDPHQSDAKLQPLLHFEPACLHCERPLPSMAPVWASKAPKFWLQCGSVSGSSFSL